MEGLGIAIVAGVLGVTGLLLLARAWARRGAIGAPGTAPVVERDVLLIPQPGPELSALGGGMGWPFRRRGDESLRIQPGAAGFHVVWRVGDDAVAHVVTEVEAEARGYFAWFDERFGTGAGRLASDRAATADERVVFENVSEGPPSRHVALLARGDGGHRVVEVQDDAVRSAAIVRDAAEGQELFALLVDPRHLPASDGPAVVEPAPSRSVAAALAAVFD